VALVDDAGEPQRLRLSEGLKATWAAYWLRITPQRLFSFAEHAWQNEGFPS
jgi:hypothetical protein